MSIPVTLTPGTLPYDCYPSPNQINIDIVTHIVAVLETTFVGLYVSATTPPVDQRGKVWFNLNDYQLYYWTAAVGAWARKHPIIAESDERKLWVGLEADLVTYDGGQVGAAGIGTGPMWVVDHGWDGRGLFGPGLIPASDPALTVIVDENEGTPQVTLTGTQVGPHQHIVPACAIQANVTDPDATNSPASCQYGIGKAQGTGSVIDPTSGAWERAFPLTSEAPATADQESVPIIPPLRGIFVIKRTIRVWILA